MSATFLRSLFIAGVPGWNRCGCVRGAVRLRWLSPTAMCFTPPLTYYQEGVADMQVILSDASFKVRLLNCDTAMTTGTYRGPTYGGPLVQLAIFQSAASARTFVAFRYAVSVASSSGLVSFRSWFSLVIWHRNSTCFSTHWKDQSVQKQHSDAH